LTASVARKQVVIQGDAGDTLTLADLANWTSSGSATEGGQTYTIYQHNSSSAQLLIDTDITVN
jgi:hypothetical protein